MSHIAHEPQPTPTTSSGQPPPQAQERYPERQCDEAEPHYPHVIAYYRQDGPGTFARDDYRQCLGVPHPMFPLAPGGES